MTTKQKSDRLLLAGLFVGGIVYTLLAMSQGRWADPSVTMAFCIEVVLFIGALTSGSLDKKGLGAFALIMSLYFMASLALGMLSETVVMAAVGMGIYAFAMSEPKFPLTKRAMGTGLIVGVVFTFLGIYLTLKLGVALFVGTELLGFLLLSAHGKYTPEENVIVVAIANGSSMISVGVLVTFPAIAIFDPVTAETLITLPFIAFVTAVSGVFGMILLAPMRNRFSKAPWPQVVPQAECIKSMASEGTARKTILTGMGASALWVGATKAAEVAAGRSLAAVPNAVVTAIPDWVGISNSPLIASIGYFMGWKRVLVILAGGIMSIVIWIALEAAMPIQFGDHLHRPEILYLALGVFVAVIAGDVGAKGDDIAEDEQTRDGAEDGNGRGRAGRRRTTINLKMFSLVEIRREIRDMIADPREYLRSRRGQVPIWLAMVSLGIFMIIGLLAFWVFTPFAGLSIHWLLIILGTPLALVSAYFTAVAVSETGMLAGYISDIVAIPAIIFFHVSFAAVTTFMSLLGGLQDSAISALRHFKLGEMTGVRSRDILKALLIGTLLGTTVGSLMTYTIHVTYGFGGTDFPSPTAQLFGFLVTSLSGLGHFQLPGIDQFPGLHPAFAFVYLLVFGVVGALMGRYLNRRGLSPISLAVGLLIPPATSVTMLFGGYIDYRLRKQREGLESAEEEIKEQFEERVTRADRLLSGVIAGETIVIAIWVLATAVTFFI